MARPSPRLTQSSEGLKSDCSYLTRPAHAQDYALKIIEENHAFWKKLVAREVDPKGIALYGFPLDSFLIEF